MNLNQKQLYEIFSEFRIQREDANYPPYHEGEYLEEYFVRRFNEEEYIGARLFIPIHWTAVFNYRVKEGLDEGSPNRLLRKKLFNLIERLPRDRKYFTVSTHDDAPQGLFPKRNTKHFYAGGNSILGTDPIPLICSGFKDVEDLQKMVFCSFIGSTTNAIRNRTIDHLYQKPEYYIQAFSWTSDISDEHQKLFYNVTNQSRFTLCPRGYGATSYRLYEAMQLGSIPVYISDKHILPWSDKLNWETFCVIVNPDEISQIDERLKSYTETEIRKFQENIRSIFSLYFTIEGAYNQVMERIW